MGEGDGAGVGAEMILQQNGAGFINCTGNTVEVPVAAGIHKVEVYWHIVTGTGTLEGISRILTVEEL